MTGEYDLKNAGDMWRFSWLEHIGSCSCKKLRGNWWTIDANTDVKYALCQWKNESMKPIFSLHDQCNLWCHVGGATMFTLWARMAWGGNEVSNMNYDTVRAELRGFLREPWWWVGGVTRYLKGTRLFIYACCNEIVFPLQNCLGGSSLRCNAVKMHSTYGSNIVCPLKSYLIWIHLHFKQSLCTAEMTQSEPPAETKTMAHNCHYVTVFKRKQYNREIFYCSLMLCINQFK